MKFKLTLFTWISVVVIAVAAVTGWPLGSNDAAALAVDLPKIVAADAAPDQAFGSAVDSTGDLLAVGAQFADIAGEDRQGAAYVFERDAANPDQWNEVKKLIASDGQAFDQLGATIAVDGDAVVVGAPFADISGTNQQGAVYMFERNQGGPDNWGQLIKLTDSSVGSGGLFGSAVAVRGDWLVVGANGASSHKGIAFLFNRNTGGPNSWGLVKTLSDPSGVLSDEFGSAADIDGDTLIIGAERTDVTGPFENDGAAFIFERNQGGPDNWGLVVQLMASDAAPNDFFGSAVALDGERAVVGAQSKDAETASAQFSYGAAYIFERNQGGPDNWGEVKKLTASDGASFDFFGSGVALNGDQVVVGAHQADIGANSDQGAIYLYQQDQGGAGNWGEVDKLTALNGGDTDYFGLTLAANGSQTFVGAYGADVTQGAVYIYDPTAAPAPPAKSSLVYLPLLLKNYIPSNATLADGSVVVSDSGAVIGAVNGTLPSPIDLAIVDVPPPPEPLTTAATPVGNYYFVRAGNTVFTPVDKPFVIGLPVPSGVQPDDLAVEMLTSAEFVNDFGGGGWVWHTSPGVYNPQHNLFVVTLSNLRSGGATLVLTEHPSHQPLAQSVDGPSPQAAPVAVTFAPTCLIVSPGPECSAANKQKVANETKAAYDDFVGQLGFNSPALNNTIGSFTGTGTLSATLAYTSNRSIAIVALPCLDHNGNKFAGIYHPSTMSLELCAEYVINGGPVLTNTIRHEFFHAIQYSYATLQTDWDQQWLTEGTAAASEKSSNSLHRSENFELHPVSVGLTDKSDLYEYKAQDFWIYTGQVLGEPLSYLESIFQQGATPAKVSNVLSLDTTYWGWVKNQVFEKKQVTFDNALKNPCTIETALADSINQIPYPLKKETQAVLTELTAAVVEIAITQTSAQLEVSAEPKSNSALKYKVYKKGEAQCEAVPDGKRIFSEVLPAGTTLYVVLANVQDNGQFIGEVHIKGPDG